MIRDRYTMGIAAEIAECLFRSTKRRLRIDDPFLTECLTEQLRENPRTPKSLFQRTVKAELAVSKVSFNASVNLPRKTSANTSTGSDKPPAGNDHSEREGVRASDSNYAAR